MLLITLTQEAFVNSQYFAAAIACAVLTAALPAEVSAQGTSTGTNVTAAQAEPGVEPRGYFSEPRRLVKGLEFVDRKLDTDDEVDMKPGFYPELGNMVTGAGWISAGVGYRHLLFDESAMVEVSTGVSWRAYKMARARFELTKLAHGRLAVGTEVRWQDLTQVTYFGAGPDSLASDRSEYRMSSVNTLGYVTVRPLESVAVDARFGWLSGPQLGPPAGAFLRGNPATEEVFPRDPVFQLDEQPSYLYNETAVTADTRDQPGYPTRGGFYRAAWTRYSDRDAGRFSFQRYEGEAAHFLPLAERHLVVALHAWVVGTTASEGQQVPFYLMPSLGGANTLRGFSDYRFHDRHLAVVNAEARLAISEHFDGVAFVDAGNVASRFGDLNLDRTSYGLGVRVHGQDATHARLDVARSVEGWRLVFRLNDPFGFSRLRKRTAQAPFAP